MNSPVTVVAIRSHRGKNELLDKQPKKDKIRENNAPVHNIGSKPAGTVEQRK